MQLIEITWESHVAELTAVNELYSVTSVIKPIHIEQNIQWFTQILYKQQRGGDNKCVFYYTILHSFKIWSHIMF